MNLRPSFPKLIVTVLILTAAATVSIIAQWQTIGSVTAVERTDDGILLTAAPARVAITVIGQDVIRVRMAPGGSFVPDSSWAVITHTLGEKNFELRDSGTSVSLVTAAGRVRVGKDPCRLAFYDANGTLINADHPGKGMAWAGEEIAVWKTMPIDERYYGFGEKAGRLERRSTTMTNWNSDIPAYGADTDPLYQTIPFFYGIRTGGAYGIFFDNTYQSYFDMGKTNMQQYSFGATGGEMNYYFFFGPAPKQIVQRFAALTGKMNLPPLWALGNQQSRWSYSPESRVREIASNFRSKQIPCDVIYLDIDYMDGYRCFTWNNERFPDPATMVSDLEKDGFKIAVIIDPGIKYDPAYWVFADGLKGGHFAMKPDGTPFLGKVWPGVCAFPDFTGSEARSWWGTLHRGLVTDGIRGFWTDMNEPSVFDVPTKTFDSDVVHNNRGMKADHRSMHNIYGMQMARGTYEGVRALRPNERPFVLTRANYAGGQRYTAAWTGDNVSSWDHLKMAISMCLNLSISGQPFVGTDIGGFIGDPSGELYARWQQLGVFTPLMRSHSVIDAKQKEPWEYGTAYEEVNRKAIGLRYQFLPYIYTSFYNASVTGVPMMRPVVFDYYDDQWTYHNDEQFLFGDALLVAPVVRDGSTRKSVRLPAGTWYDYYSGQRYSGPKDITVDAPIDRLPLFVKGGSVLPMQPVVQHTGQSKSQPLTVHLFAAGSGNDTLAAAGTLYEDDGISFEYQSGVSALRTMTMKSAAEGRTIEIAKVTGKYRLPSRTITAAIHDIPAAPATVRLNNREIKSGTSDQPNSWTYDASTRVLRVTMSDSDGGNVIAVKEQR